MLGDNIESLKKLSDNSIDSIVTDPPYGLSFMNKKWDYDVPSVDFWKQVYRVLKPGGHILSFGGTRTYHRMVVNIEDAGFEIRDQIMWLYGSGFPKSHNIGKAIDKIEGNERKVIGRKIQRVDGTTRNLQPNGGFMKDNIKTKPSDGYINIEEPGSDNSKMYEGWGTALKPSNEPICLARKPLSEKSVAENVLKWGTGGINVDGCRVGNQDRTNEVENTTHEGRFPANLILECICDNREESESHENTMCPCRLLDEQSGLVNQGHWPKGSTKGFGDFGGGSSSYEGVGTKDKTKSGASRFFYQAKVSKSERNMGLDGFDDKVKTSLQVNMADGVIPDTHSRFSSVVKNNHPTVKPINLMAYLCRLITPQGGIVLDPFMGSGSTGISAQLEGFRFVGMEMDEDYFKISQARIENFEMYRKFIKR